MGSRRTVVAHTLVACGLVVVAEGEAGGEAQQAESVAAQYHMNARRKEVGEKYALEGDHDHWLVDEHAFLHEGAAIVDPVGPRAMVGPRRR